MLPQSGQNSSSLLWALYLSGSALLRGITGVAPVPVPSGLHSWQLSATASPSGRYTPCLHFAAMAPLYLTFAVASNRIIIVAATAKGGAVADTYFAAAPTGQSLVHVPGADANWCAAMCAGIPVTFKNRQPNLLRGQTAQHVTHSVASKCSQGGAVFFVLKYFNGAAVNANNNVHILHQYAPVSAAGPNTSGAYMA